MKELIKFYGFTNETTLIEIEKRLLYIPDFSYEYYSVKKMNCNSYAEAAEIIYNYLQTGQL